MRRGAFAAFSLARGAVLAVLVAIAMAFATFVPASALADDAAKTLTVGPSASADYSSIQAAIDHIDTTADKDGWTITLEDGAYTRFKVAPSVTNLTITGGKGAMINVLDGTPDPTTKAAPDTGGINIQQTEGFTLKGVTVDCGGDTSWPHFAITNFGNAGGGNGLTVDDVDFIGTAGNALLLSSGMMYFSVTNCTFASGIDTAINVMNDNTPAGTVTITDNTFTGNNFALHGYWGGANGGKLTFSGNTVTGEGHTDGTKRCKIVIQDQMNTSAIKPVVSGNTLEDTLVGLVNVNDDGATAKDVLANNTTDVGTFAVDGIEPGTIDMYSSYVVNQGDYKYGEWVLTGLDQTDWTEDQKQLVEDAVDKANREQSPVLNITGLADGTLIHTFTWFKNAIYWTPYKDGNGKLTISKTLTGNALEGSDKDVKFIFTVTLTGDSIPEGNQVFGGVEFTDGVGRVTIKGGESKTIEGIPAGTSYTVEEEKITSVPGDELTYETEVKSGTATVDSKSKTATGAIKKDAEETVSFTNKKMVYGKLTVKKTLAGNALEANDKDDEFTFAVTLKGDYIKGEQEFGGVKFTDGVAKVTLKGGESVTLDKIPAGTSYTVEEDKFADEADKLTYEVSSENAEGTIEKDAEATASFTNTKTKEPEPDKPDTPETPDKPDTPETPETPKPGNTTTTTTVVVERRPLPNTGDDTISGAGFAVAGAVALIAGLAIRRKQHLS